MIITSNNWKFTRYLLFINHKISKQILISDLNLYMIWILNVSLFCTCFIEVGFLIKKYSITFLIINSGYPFKVKHDSELDWFLTFGN